MSVSSTQVEHPLEPATAAEYEQGREILQRASLLGPNVRFAYYGLEEPAKQSVLEFRAGQEIERRLRVYLIDIVSAQMSDVVVSLLTNSVVSHRVLDAALDGQVPLLEQEVADAEEIVRADPRWRQAMERRGITDIEKVRAAPLSAGSLDLPGEEGRRMLRVLAFLQNDESDLAWAHPVDGVAAHVDLLTREVVSLVDEELLPVPASSGNYLDPAISGPPRTDLRPIEITQPEGPSFTVERNLLSWQNWTLRVGFDAREGLILHEIAYAGRPIIYRASVPEMVVPYFDPGPTRYWQNYFDCGEYQVGRLANSLELGCDCLGEIHYLDGLVTDDFGQARRIPNAICIHEEDAGILWKHTDPYNGSSETRRQRRLVISFFTTVGNYDYGFYWYLYLDGTIELDVKLTGILFTSAYRGAPFEHAVEVAPGLGAAAHQHLFSARLDVMVDGTHNAVDEVDVEAVREGTAAAFGNGLRRRVSRIHRESEGGRDAAPERGRMWRIVNEERHNSLGQPVAYTLLTQANPTLLLDPGLSAYRRANFATRHLWVTRHDPSERYSAGDFVNQHPGGAGVEAYAARDRDLDGHDIVLWHTFGPTHFPRPEDWPVMPVDHCGFQLRPSGFFDRNPTLDVPRSGGHCHPQ